MTIPNFSFKKFNMNNISNTKKFKKVVLVDTTNIAAEDGHPRVFYKIKPSVGYVVCNYSNTCFKLSEKADIDSDEVFFYKG